MKNFSKLYFVFILVACSKGSGSSKDQNKTNESGGLVPAKEVVADVPVLRALPVGNSDEDEIAKAMIGSPQDKNKEATGVLKSWSSGGRGLYSEANRKLISNFSKNYLSNAYKNTRTVYYPFGGPDVVYPFLFFPFTQKLILVGGEKIGELPTLQTARSPEYQRLMGQMMTTYLASSFYVTKDMHKDESYSDMSTWAKMAASVALLGFEIISTEKGSLNDAGVWVNARDASKNSNSPEGVIFRCSRLNGKKSEYVEIYYFQQNLGEYYWDDNKLDSITKSQPFVRFVSNLKGNYTSYLKAASFVSHTRSAFKTSTKLIFDGNYIVQPESGVPFADFVERRQNWKLGVFGKYDGPNLELFEGRYQTELQYAYEEAQNGKKAKDQKDSYSDFVSYAGDLPFHYDYGDGPHGKDRGSTLLYGQKKR